MGHRRRCAVDLESSIWQLDKYFVLIINSQYKLVLPCFSICGLGKELRGCRQQDGVPY